MFKNYLKIAFRNISKQKGYSFINIAGLAIGIACSMLIILFIQDEISYDKFHKNADRIYRIIYSTHDDMQPTNANGNFVVGPALKHDFPEIVDFVRVRKMGQGTKQFVGYGEKKFYEGRFFFADSSIFRVFSFPLKRGNPNTALRQPNSIVITEDMAQKYFADEDPLEKTLIADPYNNGELMRFRVTGVAENVPHNSHFKFDFLAYFDNQKENLANFSSFEQVYTYLLLAKNASPKKLEVKFLDFLHRNWQQNPWYTIKLQPLLDIHLKSHLKSELEANGNIAYVYTFSIVAVFILLIACINFMNLATARSSKRAKEVGLRKVIGANKNQLFRQFLGESMILSIIAGLLSILIVELFLPVFNHLTNKNVSFDLLNNFLLVAGFVLIILAVGFLSGSYPALFLSSFRPAVTLKGKPTASSSTSTVRRGLVIFQFAISIAMIAATGIVFDQLNYIKTKNIGYDTEQIMVIPLNNEARKNYEAMRNTLLQNPGIENTTTSSLVPTKGSSHNSFKLEGVDDELSLAKYYIDKDFVATYGIQIIAGKNVQEDIKQNGIGDLMISRQALEEVGWDNPAQALDRSVEWDEFKGRITGVVNNLYIYSFHQHLYSMIFFITPIQYHDFLSIRIRPEHISESIAYINKTWSDFIPSYPLDYFFLDDSFEEMHRSDIKLGQVFSYFAVLAIFVACLGLFGLASYTAEQRTKEIGIRKVLGATVVNIIYLLSKEFTKWVILANIIALPIAYFFMNKWLQGFVYKTNLGWQVFAVSGILALVIALLTVSLQATKAAFANPVQSLRYE